jgi:hypothetical protein
MVPIHIRVLLTTLALLGSLTSARLPAAEEFQSRFEEQVDRIWVGPEFQACRHQDWRVRGGWLECAEARARYPMRTCSLLAREIDPARGGFSLRAEVRPITSEPTTAPRAAGFLVGVGDLDTDPRLRALVQGVPAPGGGLLAVVDERGRASFRDFSTRPARVGFWSIDGPLAEDACGPLPGVTLQGEGLEGSWQDEHLLLVLEVETAAAETVRLTLRVLRDGGDELSRAVVDGIPRARLAGSISLLSHGGAGGAGHGFRRVRLDGPGVVDTPESTVGPVIGVFYTVDPDALKLTAQLPPLGPEDPPTAELQLLGDDGEWTTVATAPRRPLSDTCHFRVDRHPAVRDTAFRVVTALARREGEPLRYTYDGTIRGEPASGDPLDIALISCVKNYTGDLAWSSSRIWYPHAEVVDAILASEPDLLLCAGDQIYEGDLSGPDRSSETATRLDFQTKWQRFLLAFGSITRCTPTVVIPDDHDVFHGNLWGAGNERGPAVKGMTVQDRGGYKLSPELVNMVHDAQTGHLPDPVDPAPIAGGIRPYFTRLEYGGLSLAIIGDRMWKSAPSVVLPEGQIVNGWARNPEFDWVRDGDPPGAVLLGERQESFLADWVVDYSHEARWKVLLGQSVFANVATLPPPANSDAVVPGLPMPEKGEYPEGELVAADGDSNGWPRTPRNRAVGILTRGSALHLSGDQHLASVIRYGIDRPGDAGIAFGGPSVANTWPRRWFPSTPGLNRAPGAPAYTGDFLDGFGNPMRVLAVANPAKTGREPALLHDRVPGFALVRLDPGSSSVTLECWPRGVDPLDPEAQQYSGWPITISARELDGREPWGTLIPVTSPPDRAVPLVVRVRREPGGEIIAARRLAPGETWPPPVFEPGTYTVESGDGEGPWRVSRGQGAVPRR